MVISNGLIGLKEIVGMANGQNFVMFLKEFGVSIILLNHKRDFIIIQNNTRPLTSGMTQDFMNSNNLKGLQWSANFSDNIMANIWKLLSDIVYCDKQPEDNGEFSNKYILS